jgi:hypothetical protein
LIESKRTNTMLNNSALEEERWFLWVVLIMGFLEREEDEWKKTFGTF